ncbi:MAG TPA: segregation/condensation protein A [Actinomycetota bacterium]|nr:segregation/condensation protein A [Actinomycetota bacterium]
MDEPLIGPQPAGFQVSLEVFEGPFQLLLALIGERRVDVCDVPIAQLTEDYLAHLSRMEHMDLEVTTEFLVVAATLLQLKARALIPVPAEQAQIRVDDDAERDLLIARLLEIRTFQGAGEVLRDLLAHGDRRHPAAPAPDDPSLRQLPVLSGMQAADLARTLVGIIRDAVREVDVSLLVSDEVSAQQAAAELEARLERGPFTFADVARGRSLAWAVALFLAMLELGMRGEVVLGQQDRLGDIEIRPVAA